MSYSVRLATGAQLALSSSTSCVLAHAGVIASLNAATGGGFDYAVPSTGNAFTVFRVGSGGSSNGIGTVQLTRATMASTAAGGTVLVDDGSGKWRLGAVVSDGTQVLSPDGTSVPSTAPAALADNTNPQSLPPVGTKMTLTGTASDGKLWFTAVGQSIAVQGAYVCQPATTISALAPGSIAVVQAGSSWQVMLL